MIQPEAMVTATRYARGLRGTGRPQAWLTAAAVSGLIALTAGTAAAQAANPPGPQPPQVLAKLWDAEHVSPQFPPLLRHSDVEAALKAVQTGSPDLFSLEEIGRSVEGRSLNHIWFGRGKFQVLLWSQMHGDEPSATAALFDLFEHVRRHQQESEIRLLLESLTVHAVPMLNPDGAERFQRRNAQGIDINRDALLLQSPEGRALKGLRDRLEPRIGFNLHNQSWRTSAGKTGRPATISLLAVAYDEARSENEGRVLAKKTCAVIRDALEPIVPGQIGRYDDEFEVRAFGDNLTKWGTSIVLIETGPYQADPPDPFLVRLNFVAIVTALEALASGSANAADPARYESLPANDSATFFRLITRATIVTGTGIEPFTGDVGIVASRAIEETAGRREIRQTLRIDDLGDLRVFGALETVDAGGLTVAPLFEPSLKPGDEVTLPDWSTLKGGGRLAPGEPADLVLLRPAEKRGAFRVERVIRSVSRFPG
jgi:Zinc carboxypeptidase